MKRRLDTSEAGSSTTEVVVEESSSLVTRHPTLKLTEKPPTLPSLLVKLTTSLTASHSISDKLRAIASVSFDPITSLEDAEQLVKYIKDAVKKEADLTVKVACLRFLKTLLRYPGVNRISFIEDLTELLQKERNDVIITHLLKILTASASTIPPKADVKHKILKLTVKALENDSHHVRSSSLGLISTLCEREAIKIGSGRSINILELFGEFSSDQDSRVRASALAALLTLHERGHTIDLTSFERASVALSDDYEAVRLAAMKVIWVVGQLHPERMVGDASSEQLRLLDDTFMKLCNMVNDGSMNVRAQAMRLLGSLHSVRFELLEQTLDKKLMSNLRKKKSVHD